jgi:hypothetical protein
MRKLLRHFKRMPAVFIRNPGRPLDQLQDRFACFVELIGIAAARFLQVVVGLV